MDMEAKLSYHQLISDHDQIENAALAVIASLKGGQVLATDIYAAVGKLGGMVRRHLQHEEIILANSNQAQLNGLPMTSWKEASTDFDRLCTDWITFLEEWDLEAITRRRALFCDSARVILERLNERVRFETTKLYAAALQSGAIRLR